MIPIRIRQFPHFVRQAVERHRVLGRGLARRPTFHPVFSNVKEPSLQAHGYLTASGHGEWWW